MSRLKGNERDNQTSNIEETTHDSNKRQLRQKTHMDKFYKEFFNIYLTECEKLRKLIKQKN